MNRSSEDQHKLRFERRPSPVLAEHRPMYKIGIILLVLEIASRGGKSSLPRLQLFNWAIKSIERQQSLILAARKRVLRVPAWGFDPALSIALRIAIAEGLIEETTTGYSTSDRGKLFFREIMKDDKLFNRDHAFLKSVGKGITERMIEEATSEWETK